MKKLIATGVLLLAMTGCYNIAFDSTEFNNMLTMREIADTITLACGTSDVNTFLNVLKHDTDHQYDYSILRTGGRPQIAKAITDIKNLVDEFYNKYQIGTPSVEYCKLKSKDISIGTDRIVNELGKM